MPAFAESSQAVGMAKGQRPQEHGIEGREDRGNGADGEGQGDHRHRGEAGALAQHPESVAKILA